MNANRDMHERTILLIGEAGFLRLQNSYVAVVGLGGVGGHCAEALARAGIGRLHLVDHDVVSVSNLNRQIVASKRTVGMRKIDAMAARIREVSDCAVTTADVFVSDETASCAIPEGVAFIADAIDFVRGKLALAAYAQANGIPIVSSMGAGKRLDPTRFSVRDVFDTQGDPLARSMRQGLKKRGIDRLPVVVSDEPAQYGMDPSRIGSLAPVTASAGLAMAGYILHRILQTETGGQP